MVGFDANKATAPSTGANQFELRDWDTDNVILKGSLVEFNGGATEAVSGDKIWWFDFSSVTTPGSYYVYDLGKKEGSFKFRIADDVYSDVLRAATRMFYYNRCNFEKKAEHAGTLYADGPSFVGTTQDNACPAVEDKGNASKFRDLSGGWWDAGDYNKYVTFARQPMHQLLSAYDENPKIWGDNNKIPESGNGLPDLIDEIKYEIEWLKKMQLTDGSVLLKMGNLRTNGGTPSLPPSTDKRPRYYYQNSCSSSTIAFAGMLAHAAEVLKKIPSQTTYAADLATRAEKAFAHYLANPRSETCDDGTIMAGDADVNFANQDKFAVQAAVFLYAYTGKAEYNTYFTTKYGTLDPISNGWWGPYTPDYAEALLYYTTLANATPAVKNTIVNSKKGNRTMEYYTYKDNDGYRSYMPISAYHWGSHNVRGSASGMNYDMITYNIDPDNKASYEKRAEEMLHYFHGLNPLNIVYLSNMYQFGATNSINEIYHEAFANNSAWDNALTSSKGGPPPGYIVGGPNKDFKMGDGSTCILVPPCNNPPSKSYSDWNTIWPDGSWAISEPAIYYQAAYLRALSKFATLSNNVLPLPNARPTVPNTLEPEKVLPTEKKADTNFQYIQKNGKLFIRTSSGAAQPLAINMYNTKGKVVFSQKLTTKVSENIIEIPTANLSGLYLLKIQTSKGIESRKMIF
jgi:endoglucanase